MSSQVGNQKTGFILDEAPILLAMLNLVRRRGFTASLDDESAPARQAGWHSGMSRCKNYGTLT